MFIVVPGSILPVLSTFIKEGLVPATKRLAKRCSPSVPVNTSMVKPKKKAIIKSNQPAMSKGRINKMRG